jgi:hypothetical protein
LSGSVLIALPFAILTESNSASARVFDPLAMGPYQAGEKLNNFKVINIPGCALPGMRR